MANKPITLIREEYRHKIIDLTNETILPAFVKVDVIGNILQRLTEVADAELRRDAEQYAAEKQRDETADTGGDDKS